jgi:hypothetical protein
MIRLDENTDIELLSAFDQHICHLPRPSVPRLPERLSISDEHLGFGGGRIPDAPGNELLRIADMLLFGIGQLGPVVLARYPLETYLAHRLENAVLIATMMEGPRKHGPYRETL